MSFVLSQGIDLENIVYYKDDTHYFVMTAKKQSLLEKGVIRHVGINFSYICCKLRFWYNLLSVCRKKGTLSFTTRFLYRCILDHKCMCLMPSLSISGHQKCVTRSVLSKFIFLCGFGGFFHVKTICA